LRFPNYKNQRVIDPYVKSFLDSNEVVHEPTWNLPTPNEEAAYKSLSKYGKDFVNMPEAKIKNLNKAWSWMQIHFHPYMGDSRVLDLPAAMSRLDMSTSSGAPFNKEFSTKGELFEGDPDIIQWLEDDFETLAYDPNYTALASSSLKEELRPNEKILENSQRTFTAMAADMTVHGTRLFVEMNEKMYESHLRSSSVIGMSPLKGNWDRLYRKLNVFKNGYALDESQYDSSLREFLMWGCALYRYNCLASEERTPANLQRFKTYYRNLCHTLIVTADGNIVMKKAGNPSGSVNTVTDNTLILYWMLAYAWIELSPADYCTLALFEEHTAKALLGDDNTWTVSDVAHEWFNARTVIEVWKTIGITTTTDSLEPRRAVDLDFLSAHTVFLGEIAVPLYDRNKLMQSLLYADKKHLTPETSLVRVCCLLQIGWTDLVFRRYCRALIQELLTKYDHILCNDLRWIQAKTNIQTDSFYYKLFTGGCNLKPQMYQECRERSIKPDKRDNMSSKPKKSEEKSKSARRPRARGPKKGNATGPKPKQPRAKRPRRRAGRLRAGGMASGVGNTNFKQQNVRSITVSNEEFIGAVTVANQPNFNVVSYPINPGQATTFPWLSKQAAQWEKYRFQKLEFFFKREVSEFSTAGQAGKVILSVDFDASDAPPGTKQQMEDTIPHADGMPCENISLRLPPKQMHPSQSVAHYVRIGGLPGNSDIKTFDVGLLHVATQGIPSNTEVGELRVRYSVTFTVPVLENLVGVPANYSCYNAASSALVSTNTTIQTVIPLATTVLVNGINAINAAGVITLPAGNYEISGQIAFDDNATGSVITLATFDLMKNGATLLKNSRLQIGAAAVCVDTTLNISPTFVTMNGTDTVNLRYLLTATLAGIYSASIFIQSV